MKLPFLSPAPLPFEGIQNHAQIVKECGWAFQQAMECFVSKQCQTFEDYRQEVDNLESEADKVKRSVRETLPLRTKIPVLKFQLFMYLKEQDKVLDSVEDALNWISYRTNPGIPDSIKKDFLTLVDMVIDPIEELSRMVAEGRKYFDTYSDRQRNRVKEIIKHIRQIEHEVDHMEDHLKQEIFTLKIDPITVFHTVNLIEIIGSIADHAENAGDMMRAMIAKGNGLLARKYA